MNKRLIAIIFAAGRGTRLKPLTDKIPKPLAKAGGSTLIDLNLKNILPKVDRTIIVVNYLAKQIQEHFDKQQLAQNISFAYQKNPKGGTLDAFKTGFEYFLNTDLDPKLEQTGFLVSNSDDFHQAVIYQKLFQQINSNPDQGYIVAKLIKDKTKLCNYGVLKVDPKDRLEQIVEKPKNYVSSLVNTGIYYFPGNITKLIDKPKDTPQNREWMITTDLIEPYLLDHHIQVIKQDYTWLPVSNLQELASLNQFLRDGNL
jgi:bifunctional UDP-N-acetylglucosamine pyrophosphorylase/glucosamine-1-phosphate N-acetyltransferase